MDFFIGEVTRDHGDIDWFAWAKDASALTTGLLRAGYEPLSGPPVDQRLDFRKQGVKSSFALLAKDRFGPVVVAGSPWAGEVCRRACSMLPPAAWEHSGTPSSVPAPRSRSSR
ncbi:hypothetical protein ACIBW9_35425 [Streptomyces sp. NPDC049541]|uniref:hypothetical protein n=1 Tax=Streptomyces sp. NPDC049541 TaxID=3365594 RepID=UPI00378921DC